MSDRLPPSDGNRANGAEKRDCLLRSSSLRVLVSPDKFKGTLNAVAAAEALRAGWLQARPLDECRCVPIADGGEGFLDAIASSGKWESIVWDVQGPLGSMVAAKTLVSGSRAAIETSSACGLHLVPKELRNPANTDTFGVGELLLSSSSRGVSLLYAGLGGSSTNDGGFGMARALGFRFLDKNGSPLHGGPLSLLKLERIAPPEKLVLPRILVASDVANTLLGENGCTRVFGPQKGLRVEDINPFEESLSRLCEFCRRDLGVNHETTPGSGAAGGLGFGFLVFCGAQILPGFEIVAEALMLEEHLEWADVVLTGEGSLDSQSLGGKAPVALARLARQRGKPVECFAGVMADNVDWRPIFQCVTSLTGLAGSTERAIKDSANWLFEASRRRAKEQKS
jgi:glycerate kinase